MRQPWVSSPLRVWPVHYSPTAPSCQLSIQPGGDMRRITNIAKTIPVTRPAVHQKLFHLAAAKLTPMTKGAKTASRMRNRLRFRRSQACVSSSYFLAAFSPAFLDARGCNTPNSMPRARASCGRNGQSGIEHAGRLVGQLAAATPGRQPASLLDARHRRDTPGCLRHFGAPPSLQVLAQFNVKRVTRKSSVRAVSKGRSR